MVCPPSPAVSGKHSFTIESLEVGEEYSFQVVEGEESSNDLQRCLLCNGPAQTSSRSAIATRAKTKKMNKQARGVERQKDFSHNIYALHTRTGNGLLERHKREGCVGGVVLKKVSVG